jgi:hypothetical protein
MAAKDCPMCGERMRRHETVIVNRVPGTSETTTARAVEWRCPECDYFEDADRDSAEKSGRDVER